MKRLNYKNERILLIKINDLCVYLYDIHKSLNSDHSIVKDNCYWLKITVEYTTNIYIGKRLKDSTLFMTTFCYNPTDNSFYDRSGKVISAYVAEKYPRDFGALAFFKFIPDNVEDKIREYLRRIEILPLKYSNT